MLAQLLLTQYTKMQNDIEFMELALQEAKKAFKKGEVPIGAVVVKDGKVIAKAYNTKETKKNTTYHAEINVINKASKKLRGWRLLDCTLYVTMEPCIMCAGAIYHARIPRVVFGCFDHKFGGFGSLVDVNQLKTNHKVKIKSGILAEKSAKLLKEFFQKKRSVRN